MKKKVKSIKDIAKIANVGVTTVSRYLNTPGLLKVSTRDRIKKVIEESNYHPSPIARGMRSKKTKNLLILLEMIESPFYIDVLFGAEQSTSNNGYNLFIVNLNKNQNRNKTQRSVLSNRNYDGVIFCTDYQKEDEYIYKTLEDDGIQMVFINNEDFEGKYNIVSTNNYQAAFDGTQYLIDKGHKEIALVTSTQTKFVFNRREKGYKDTLLKNSLNFNTSYIYETDLSLAGGEKVAEELLRDLNKYTAIFCLSDFIALGIIGYFKKNNISIPEDISLIGFDDIPYIKISTPPLTTIHQKKKKLGYLAVERLISILNGKSKGKISIKLDAYIVERESVKDITKII